MTPKNITRELCERLANLRFSEPVTHVYNPLTYARTPHERYLQRYGKGKKRYLLLGMNPENHFAFLGLSFHDGEEFGVLGLPFEIEAQVRLASVFVRTVAGEAFVGQNRTDLAVEVERSGE